MSSFVFVIQLTNRRSFVPCPILGGSSHQLAHQFLLRLTLKKFSHRVTRLENPWGYTGQFQQVDVIILLGPKKRGKKKKKKKKHTILFGPDMPRPYCRSRFQTHKTSDFRAMPWTWSCPAAPADAAAGRGAGPTRGFQLPSTSSEKGWGSLGFGLPFWNLLNQSWMSWKKDPY